MLATGALQPVTQHYLLQARQMQALSFAVHIPLVCFGIAFPVMIMFVEWRHLRTGDDLYRTLARRWSRIMAALFAVGVITGTILSFEMGLLWPNFTATFGSVFGLGFAIEGFSFFLEAIFIGIYIYGWDRLSPRAHLLSGVPIVAAGFTGSLMVISVNAWMQHPSGFALRGGKAVDVRPLKALFDNSFLWHELVHMYIAAYIVTGLMLAAAYAVGRMRGRWGRYERTALAIPLSIAALASPVQVLVGDWAAREVAVHQPTKLAAIEGLAKTTRGAPEHLLGWYEHGQVKFGIAIPKMLSLLAFHNPNATVQGLDAVPAAQRPPVNVVRVAFQLMVGIGTLLAMLGMSYLFVRVRHRRLPESQWFYRALVLAGPLSIVALIAGWVVTEVGRQPWVVYKVMLSSAAVTGAHGIAIAYGTLAGVYLLVGCGVVWILVRLARAPLPDSGPSSTEGSVSVHLYDVPMVFILIGLALYAVLAGADFGAGLWTLLGGSGPQARRIREHAHHSMAPVWEANHVWLIFVLTVMWTAYPTAFSSIASTLAVALFIAGIGIVLRGAAYALDSGFSAPLEGSRGGQRALDLVFSLSSLITPFALGAMAGAIASRRVPLGNASGHLLTSWLNPTSTLVGVLAVASAAYLAAVYLAADAARAGDDSLEAQFRLRALISGVVAGAIAIAGLIVLRSDAHPLYGHLLDGAGLVGLIVSVISGIAALVLVFVSRFALARFTAALAVAAIIAGWALAQQPLLLPGLTIEQAAAPHDTLVVLTVAVIAGGAILFPSLALLFRLLLQGQLDHGAADDRRPAEISARLILSSSSTGLLGRLCLAALISGFVFLSIAEAGWAHVVGVVCLFLFLICGFAALEAGDEVSAGTAQGTEQPRPSGDRGFQADK